MAERDARRMLAVAEVAHQKGKRDRAVSLAEKALAAASAQARPGVERDLARFRRGDRAPSPALAALSPEGDDQRRSESRGAPPWIAVASKLSRKIADDCPPADEPIGDLPLHIFSGVRPEELKLVPERPLPAALLGCIERVVRAVEVPPNQAFSIPVTLDPPWFAQGLAVARKTASECLPAPRPGDRIEPLHILLTSLGDRPQIVTPPGQQELARCLERAFWFVRLPPGMVRGLYLMPARPRPADGKPLTAENQAVAP
jgi:hypothetical protein